MADRWTGPLTLHHPGAPRLLRTFGLDELATTVGDGSFSSLATLSAAPGEIRVDTLQVSAGGARLAGTLSASLGATASVRGQLDAESLPLPADLFAPDRPLPTTLLRGWNADLQLHAASVTFNGQPVASALTAHAALTDGALALTEGSATLDGGPVTWGAAVDAGAEPPRFSAHANVTGAVVNGPLPVASPVTVGSGTLAAQLDVRAAGHSLAALAATLEGQGDRAGKAVEDRPAGPRRPRRPRPAIVGRADGRTNRSYRRPGRLCDTRRRRERRRRPGRAVQRVARR